MKTFYEKYPNFKEPDDFQIIRVSKHTWRYRNWNNDNDFPNFKHYPILYDYANDILNLPGAVITRISLCNIYSKILIKSYCEHI